MNLVMPPKVAAGEVFGMALYSAKGLLSGRGDAVTDLIEGRDQYLSGCIAERARSAPVEAGSTTGRRFLVATDEVIP